MGTPRNVIFGWAELLLEQTEERETQPALQNIVRQVKRLICAERGTVFPRSRARM
jgi:hypothetical protein